MMNEYKVEIKEELSRVINVTANCHEEAVEKAKSMYQNEEIILNYSDIKSTEFKPLNCDRKKKKTLER